MKITQSYSRVKNIGNYENVRVGVSLEKEVNSPSVEKIQQVSDQLHCLCKRVVEQKLTEGGQNAGV